MSAVIAAIIVMGSLGALTALALSAASTRFGHRQDQAVERIVRVLPQTQCAQCGYPGCRPYAQALLEGQAAINRCPPGGEATIQALSKLLNRPALALDTSLGETRSPAVAFIDEQACIGCALCLPACPVDAIVGAPQFMHTVIADECTGCELCIEPCPVDCISLVEVQT